MESLLSGNLSLVIFFPLLGIPLIVLLSYIYKGSEAEMKIAALAVSLIEFVLSIPLFTSFAGAFPGMQFETKIPWIANLGISYHVGLDGISLFLVLLTTFMMPITILSSIIIQNLITAICLEV